MNENVYIFRPNQCSISKRITMRLRVNKCWPVSFFPKWITKLNKVSIQMYFPLENGWFFCIHYYDFHIKIQILFTWVVWLALSVSNFKMECSEMQTEMKILVTVFCFSNLIWVFKTFCSMILKNYTKSTLVTFTEYRHLKSIDLIGKNTDNVMLTLLSLIKTTWTKKFFFFCFCQVWHSNGLFIVTKTSLKRSFQIDTARCTWTAI